MILVQTSDFVGEFKVPADQYNVTILQKIIDSNEASYIRKIFGATMGNDVITYIQSPSPSNPEFDKLINPFQEDVKNKCACDLDGDTMIESKGLKYALIAFLYSDFQFDAKLIPNQVGGLTRPKSELNNSDMLPQAQIIMKYNDGVDTVRAIQVYMRNNHEDYPDMNPQRFDYNYIL